MQTFDYTEIESITDFHLRFPVGAIVLAGKRVMSTIAGELGIVYEHYDNGIAILFRDGSYDRFNKNCMETFEISDVIAIHSKYTEYEFHNVTRLIADYRYNYFDNAFYPNVETVVSILKFWLENDAFDLSLAQSYVQNMPEFYSRHPQVQTWILML